MMDKKYDLDRLDVIDWFAVWALNHDRTKEEMMIALRTIHSQIQKTKLGEVYK